MCVDGADLCVAIGGRVFEEQINPHKYSDREFFERLEELKIEDAI